SLCPEAGISSNLLRFDGDPTMRRKIYEGSHLFIDHHLSHTAKLLRADVIESIDYAILEAISVTDDGLIIPTTPIGNSLAFAKSAENIIIEINLAQTESLAGVHDLYSSALQG